MNDFNEESENLAKMIRNLSKEEISEDYDEKEKISDKLVYTIDIMNDVEMSDETKKFYQNYLVSTISNDSFKTDETKKFY
jgi:hypothetical protein